MKFVTRAILIVGALLYFTGPPVAASDGGWILWELTFYIGLNEAERARQGFVDKWTAMDGYDTAIDCHAAMKTKEAFDKPVNAFGATQTPVHFMNVNRCFPVAFDPRKMAGDQ